MGTAARHSDDSGRHSDNSGRHSDKSGRDFDNSGRHFDNNGRHSENYRPDSSRHQDQMDSNHHNNRHDGGQYHHDGPGRGNSQGSKDRSWVQGNQYRRPGGSQENDEYIPTFDDSGRQQKGDHHGADLDIVLDDGQYHGQDDEYVPESFEIGDWGDGM